ncbi:MAG: ATP-grasp domain-containing protein [Ignavibacteriales bacterium]|nr:ATP-grasp domain-containing protein [Ignavibacteriales bacterium]
MSKKIHVAIIYNEPTVETENGGREYASKIGMSTVQYSKLINESRTNGKVIDLSEVGVMEEKEDIQAAMISLGYDTSIFNMSDDLDRFLAYLKAMQPDIIFNMVECLGDSAIHEMHVAGIYELLGFTYTGAGPMTLGTCLNKARAKEVLSFNGIPTAKFFVCKDIKKLIADDIDLSYPMFVKPSNEDASVGIDNKSVVNTFQELKERVGYILRKFNEPAIVEEYIDGRELNVGIIGNKKPIVLPISEIDFSGLPDTYPKIVTYDAKWMEGTVEYSGTQGKCPAQLSPAVEEKIKEIALRAYQLMGCRDYARVDIRLSKNNKPYVLEVNPNPDLSDDAGFYRSAKTYGLSYTETVGKIVEYAIERHPTLGKQR